MKIAFYTTTILEFGGGFEKYLIETAKNLSEFDDVQIDIITTNDKFTLKINILFSLYFLKKFDKSAYYKESLNVIKQKLERANYYKIDTFKNLQKKLNKYDIIYSKNEIPEAFIFKFLIGYKNLPPIIFGCHTPIYYPTTKSVQSKLHNILYNGFVYKFLASGIKIFHTINSSDEKRLKRLFSKKEIIKICNPFDFNEFIQKAEKYKFDFNFDKTKFNVLWTGRLTEQKGTDDLIEIINKINKTKYKNKIIWNIAGDGEDKQKILDLKEKWDNVNYFGYIENNYVASIYKENDLFISTSKWEGFPYNLLEAQSFGLPVISYNISGCNDIIENNKNGFLVDNLEEFKEKILFFIKGNKLEIDIARFIKSKFNKDKIYKNLINIFKEYDKKI